MMTQTQNFLLQSVILTLALLLVCVSAQSYNALVAPITKDANISLFSITLNFDEKYVIDLGGPFFWYRCPRRRPTVACHSLECLAARSYHSPLCSPFNSTGRNQCTCVVTAVNPITKMCALAEFTYKNLIISWINGNVMSFDYLYASCAPKTFLSSLPMGDLGMASLSRSSLALPRQFTDLLGIKKQFAICLPSSSAVSGLVVFGEGPFYLQTPKDLDVVSILSYTRLIKHSKSSEYYIGLSGISINREACTFPSRMLKFDSIGHGGVKLSTIVPYTTLRSHIYKNFVKHFARATRGIPRAKKVKPFNLCLNTSTLGSTWVGLPVPQIDLELAKGKNWTIFGANSMKHVSHDVACLAFVDGGERFEQAMVIGSFQIENNFLLFDLEKSSLGFSSSLLFVRTTCANFNFTSGP